jgi:sugar lactone lactonase YvrE
MSTPQAELILDTKSTLGEGAIWNTETQRLLWVNIPDGEVNEFDPETKANKTIKIPNQSVGTVVPRLNKPRSVAIVTTKAFAFLGKHVIAIWSNYQKNVFTPNDLINTNISLNYLSLIFLLLFCR